MKHAAWFTVVAVVLLSLAAVGWILSVFQKPAIQELAEARGHAARLSGYGAPLSAAR